MTVPAYLRWKSSLMYSPKLFLRSPDDGARTSVHLCTSPDVAQSTGLYYQNEKPKRPTDLALDDEAAERLWRMSAEMVGLPA